MLDRDLLEMKLADVSDLLLERRCESGKDVAYVQLDGCNVKSNERMRLTVCLRSIDEDDD